MVQETQSSNRTLIILLAVGALLFALLVVAAVLVFVLGQGDSEEGAAAAESAKLMPADTFMYVSFNPHLDEVKNFEVIEKAWGDNPLIQQALSEMLAEMAAEGVDYRTEIEPWLGNEIAFSMGSNFLAAMDTAIEGVFEEIADSLSGVPGQSPQVGAPPVPQFAIAIATTDKNASDKFLDKLRAETQQDGTTFQETEHGGVKIFYYEPQYEWDSGMAYATVDDFIVLTTGLEAMQALIDARDGDNLAENQNYKDVLDKLPADQISYGYLDAGAYMEAALQAAGPALAEIPSELFDPQQLQAIKGMGFSVGFEPNGLRVDFVSLFDKDALPESMLGMQASPNKAAGHVPASTLFYISGGGLGDALQMGLDMITAMPDVPPDFDEQMQRLTGMLGVSLDDLVEMLSGEFALAITHDPAGIGGDPSVPIGLSVLIEAREREKLETLLSQLSMLLGMGAEMQFPTQEISGVEVTTIPNPYGQGMIAGWGIGPDFCAFGTSQELLEAAFGGGGAKLADDATYKATTAPLPGETSGVFYMNLEKLFDVMAETMSPWERESFDQNRPLLAPIKAISAASEPYDKDKGWISGTLFVLIESE